MSASNLIDLVYSKGYSIAKKESGVYQYWDKTMVVNDFIGTWNQFVKLVKAL